MAQFQRIAPNPQLQTPQVPTPRYGAAFRAFGEVGQVGDVFQRIQDSADIAEASRLSQTIAAQIGAAVTKAEMDNAQDPDAYSQVAGDSIQTVFDNGVAQTNPRVRALVTERLSDDMIKLRSGIEQKSYKMKLNKARIDWMVARDEGLNRRILSDDPVEQSAIDAQIMGDLGALSGKGAFTVDEAYKERKRYAQDILVKKAQTMIDNGQADQVLRDSSEGLFNSIDPDARRRLMNDARAGMDRDEKANEQARVEVKRMVMNGWQAAANRGQLQRLYPDDVQNAIDGKHPYITAKEARELMSIDNNPPTGENDDAVRALRFAYRMTPGGERDVIRAQQELAALSRQMGRQSKVAEDYANELQSDLFRAKNLATSQEANAIARQNRDIRNMQTEYEAWKEDLDPVMKRFFGNQDEQNKAKIAYEYRINGPEAARKLLDSLVKRQQSTVDKIPSKNRSVIELVK